MFEELDPRFLLTFSNLEKVTFTLGSDLNFSLIKNKLDDSDDVLTQNFTLTINSEGEEHIRSFKLWLRDLITPEEILERTAKTNTDRERLVNVQTSIIFETTPNSRGQFERDNKLFVYYPTERNIPLDILIHGDFILDGSRKHLTKYSEGSFNHWLLEENFNLLIDTVNYFNIHGQSSFGLKLIRLAGNTRDFHAHITTIEEVIGAFKTRILTKILLPTNDRSYSSLQDIIFPYIELAYRDQAIPLIEIAYPNKKIAIDELCIDEIHSITSEYKDNWIIETVLLNKLTSPPTAVKSADFNTQWSIHAWQWLSNGFEEGSKFSKTLSCPSYCIIPTSDGLVSASGSSALPCIVELENDLDQIPDWLEVSALPIPFMQWLRSSNSLTKQLREKLGISKFSEKFVVKAFSEALSSAHYKEGDPTVLQAYLDFAISRQWHLRADLEDFNWENSPISAIHLPAICALDDSDETWILASECYLGTDWSNPDIDLVLPVAKDAPRVSPKLKEQYSDLKRFLLICGAHLSPRLSVDFYPDAELKSIYWTNIVQKMHPDLSRKLSAPEHHSQPKPKFLRLNKLNAKELGTEAACALLRIIRNQWSAYFEPVSTATAEYSHYYTKYKYSAPNIWVNDLKQHLQTPSDPGTLIATKQLGQLWVHTPETPVWAKKLFPRLLSDEIFPDPRQRADFDAWIIKTPFVKTQASDIEHSDWVNYIFPSIIDFVEDSQLELDEQIHTVTLYYRALIDYYSIHGHGNLKAPRIALQSDTLRNISNDEPIWVTASTDEFYSWQEHIPVFLLRKEDLTQNIIVCFQFTKLSDDIQQTLSRESTGQLTDHTPSLQAQAAWIFSYRSHENKQRLPIKIWREIKLFVTEEIAVNKSIGKVSFKTSDPYYFDSDTNTLYITYGARSQNDVYAEALIKTFKLPESDTDRIELLLGFDDEQRIKRLTKEMSREDYDLYCAEYTGATIVTSPADSPISEVDPEPDLIPSSSPQERFTDAPPQENRTTEPSPRMNDQSYYNDELAELHDRNTEVDMFSVITPSQPSYTRTQSEPQTGYRQVSESLSMSSAVPRNHGEIETLSRNLVEDQLVALGYSVEQMGQKNKGYDITATKGDQKIFIEVKGNQDARTAIFLTPAERELAENPGDNKQWQLWHVSNLSKSSDKPIIRVYSKLLSSACTPEKYIVELSLLEQIQPQ